MTKKTLILISIFFCLSLINLRTKLFLTPHYSDGLLEKNHQILLKFQYTNNEQSRLLQYLIPQFLITTFHTTIVEAYILQRLVFTFLVFLVFYLYLRKWFTCLESLGGVSFLGAIMPLTYRDDLQESTPLLLLTFLLGLYAIRENKVILFLIVLTIGLFNNETVIFLPVIYFFYHFINFRLSSLLRLINQSLLTLIPVLIFLIPIRYATFPNPHLGPILWLPFNLRTISNQLWHLNFLGLYNSSALYIFFIFGTFWILPWFYLKKSPLFLKRAYLIVPFFVLGHLLVSNIDEVRDMLPLSFIILPLGFLYFKDLKEVAFKVD